MLPIRTLFQSWVASSSLSLFAAGGTVPPATSSGIIATAATRTVRMVRSNATHLHWCEGRDDAAVCEIQSIMDAKRESYSFLRRNAMELDLPFLETLGFHDTSGHDDDHDIDGLTNGLVNSVIDLSIQAKINFTYTDQLPKEIWQEYILNYASLNEARSSIRKLLHERLVSVLLLNAPSNSSQVTDGPHSRSLNSTLQLLHQNMWTLLAPSSATAIQFVAGQTPAIFDPMSVLAFGYASCTGMAILMVQALRAAGIPARVVGTAAWNGNERKGNHNWVEVYDPVRSGVDDDDWWFFEPDPRGGFVAVRDPRAWWFCSSERMRNTTVTAAALVSKNNHTVPLAWEPRCHAVPGVDRTDYYQNVCRSSNSEETQPSGRIDVALEGE